MKIRLVAFCFFLNLLHGFSQSKYTPVFVKDTMSIPETGKILEGEYVETTFKNLSVVRMFKSNDGKFYLRMIVTKNFYFDKVGVLEIQSGTKSYYAKNTKQFKVSKTEGLFLIEIFSNYIATLKQEGITGIVFAEAQTDFTKQDASNVKKMAGLFYENFASKK